MRRTKEESEKTRESILDAAAKKFFERGVAAATLSEIAREAGVTRGAIYWHFENKMDIFDALHERIYNPLSEIIKKDKIQDIPDPLTRLQEICNYILINLETDKHLKYSVALYFIRCDYSKEWASFREKHYFRKNENLRLFSYYVEKAAKKEQLSKGTDVTILSLSLFCFIRGIIIAHLKDPELFDLKNEGILMVDDFFKGIKARNRHCLDTQIRKTRS